MYGEDPNDNEILSHKSHFYNEMNIESSIIWTNKKMTWGGTFTYSVQILLACVFNKSLVELSKLLYYTSFVQPVLIVV